MSLSGGEMGAIEALEMFGIVGEVGGREDAAVSADPAKKKR